MAGDDATSPDASTVRRENATPFTETASVPSTVGVAAARAASTAPEALLGTRLGRYVLKSILGVGGMGVVYAAYDPTLDRRVALKLLRGDRHVSARARQRLVREARAMAKLSHANVIMVHEIGSAGGSDFVVMELIEGVSLAEWLQGTNPDRTAMPAAKRPWREVIEVFLRAGQGLAAAHKAALIHRGCKPV